MNSLPMIDFQFSLSTQQEEANYFTDAPVQNPEPSFSNVMPPGIYRVMEGRLYRVLLGPSPLVEPTERSATVRMSSGALYEGTILVDTSAVIALHLVTDSFHREATNFLAQEHADWVALDVTAHESFTRIRYDVSLPAGMEAYGFLRASKVKVIRFNPEDEVADLAALIPVPAGEFQFLYPALHCRC